MGQGMQRINVYPFRKCFSLSNEDRISFNEIRIESLQGSQDHISVEAFGNLGDKKSTATYSTSPIVTTGFDFSNSTL